MIPPQFFPLDPPRTRPVYDIPAVIVTRPRFPRLRVVFARALRRLAPPHATRPAHDDAATDPALVRPDPSASAHLHEGIRLTPAAERLPR